MVYFERITVALGRFEGIFGLIMSKYHWKFGFLSRLRKKIVNNFTLLREEKILFWAFMARHDIECHEVLHLGVLLLSKLHVTF